MGVLLTSLEEAPFSHSVYPQSSTPASVTLLVVVSYLDSHDSLEWKLWDFSSVVS